MQNNPAQPWTVAELASEVNISRAALAKRFTELVGEPPMTFLTSWRIDLAADLLRRPDITVGTRTHYNEHTAWAHRHPQQIPIAA